MNFFKNFTNIFSIPELRKKLLFTLGVLIVHRLGTHIPVIGVDISALHAMMEQVTSMGGILSHLDMLSGGALRECTLFALGIMPYISASIMMQMLGVSVPYYEQLAKEGEYGRKIMNQHTRYLAFGLSIVQSIVYATILERKALVLEPGWKFRLMFILSLTVGSMFVMWLGEQISLFGIGNGSSMIIFSGIVSQFPNHVIRTIGAVQTGQLGDHGIIMALIILAIFIAITSAIVYLERGERKIPVQYTRRVVGQRVYSAQSTYIPFKINPAGVMPVILAGAFLNIPTFIATALADKITFFKWITDNMQQTSLLYNVLQFFLIIFFSFIYTALIFNPDELADNIKKSGGFIPGIRPGKKTAEYFNYILTRLGSVGSIYIAILAALPNILRLFIRMPFYLGGTGLLIVVGVALELASQIESYLIEHRYEGFLTSGRMVGRSGR